MKPTRWELKSRMTPSPPMRGRGLKLITNVNGVVLPVVAPHAGAWIETKTAYSGLHSPMVAPHAGAWIETWQI